MSHKNRWILLAWVIILILLTVPAAQSVVAQGDPGGSECGCVRSPGYWKNHPWPEGVMDEGLAGEDITWAQALAGKPRGSAYWILARQYVAARLNVAAGANPECSVCVSSHLTRAANYLSQPYSYWSETWREEVIADAQYLDDWNNGRLAGVPSCPD